MENVTPGWSQSTIAIDSYSSKADVVTISEGDAMHYISDSGDDVEFYSDVLPMYTNNGSPGNADFVDSVMMSTRPMTETTCTCVSQPFGNVATVFG